MIEKVEDNGLLIALIVRSSYNKDGLNFVTDKESSFQVGIHKVETGKRYKAHKSKPFKNIDLLKTNKIYYVQEGSLGVDIYNDSKKKITYSQLNSGDLIIFFNGAHGVDVLKDSKFVELKQGPYRGTLDDKEFIE